MAFTTRPELRGTFGMVASTHWLASAAGMSVLERGGNAFDAACATGFVLQVVEPHLNGPGGEVPAVFWSADREQALALCGQGVAPAAATIERFHELGHDLVPGTGLLAACVPGAFGGWLLLLRELRHMAPRGGPRDRDRLRGARATRCTADPGDDRAHCGRSSPRGRGRAGCTCHRPPAGALPEPGARCDVPAHRGRSRGGSREEEIERARKAWYEGFVAEEIDRFSSGRGRPPDRSGPRAWEATLEPVATYEYRGLTVCKTLPWAAGPVGLQQLALLQGYDLGELSEAEFVHVVTECAKLAFADRDALYGDADVRLDILLSDEYNDERRALVGEEASSDYNPGYGRLPSLHAAEATVGSGEPGRGTVHLDVADRFGNVVSATPSGGWLTARP